jgi:hypothetical protein
MGVALRYLLMGAVGFAGVQTLWPAVQPSAPAPETAPDRSASVQLALDQIVLAVKQYARTGDPAEREDFGRRMARFGEMLELLDGQAHDADGRGLMSVVRRDVTSLGTLGQELVARPPQSTPAEKLTQLGELRDKVVLTITEVREAHLRQAGTDADPMSGLLRKLASAGLATAVLCLAAAGALARSVG